MMTSVAAAAAGTDQPAATAAKIKTASHTKFLTRPADLIVEERLLLELKSIDRLHPFHTSQMVTYLKAVGLRHGLILNFNAPRLIDGLRSVVLG